MIKPANRMLRSIGYHSIPFICIFGTQKCATSALYKYESVHPQLSLNSVKETDDLSERIYYWGFDKKIYSKNFALPHRGNWLRKRCFEASPSYLSIPNRVARTFSLEPNAKIIVLLRNSVERAISAYIKYKRSIHHRDQKVRSLLVKHTL